MLSSSSSLRRRTLGNLIPPAATASTWIKPLCNYTQLRTSSSAATSPVITSLSQFSLAGYQQRRDTILQKIVPGKEQELAALRKLKAECDSQASKAPDTVAAIIFFLLISQNLILFQWTYYTFDWNLVEPITYLLGYSVVWLSSLYYFIAGKEWTWDGLRDLVEERKKKILYKQKYNDEKTDGGLSLDVRIETLEKQLVDLKKIAEDLKNL